MNVLDEIAQSYVYNGEISLKALDDDIVTIENQIEKYESTLNELKLRKKNPALLIEKIRDAKIKLSLLKTVYKRESKNVSPENAMLNAIGTSGKEAKEAEPPGTAADGKTPLPQNFDEADIEEVDNGEYVYSAENEKLNNKDVLVKDDENKDILVKDNEHDIIGLSENQEMKNDIVVETEKSKEIVSGPKISDSSENDTDSVEMINEKTTEYKAINYKKEKSNDYTNPTVDKNKEKEEIAIGMEKFKVSDDVYDLTKATDEEFVDFCSTLNSDDVIKVVDGSEVIGTENEIPTSDCPPPTIDDYKEPISPMNEISLPDMVESDCCDLKSYRAFPPEHSKIYASLDLCDYTDLVNTDFIDANVNLENKTLELVFNDNLDYVILLKILHEMNRTTILDKLFKKPKSIFMYVYEEGDNESTRTKFEFTNCKVKKLNDTIYLSRRQALKQENVAHPFLIVFKYKDLKIS